jgi:uncharacterized protein YbjT (DUF2867 family)
MNIRVVITGATGMVGEGVLHECLRHPSVEEVLVVNRKPCGVAHPKLKEIIQRDFLDTDAYTEKLAGYNACYFCAGVSSVGKTPEDYYTLTHDLTIAFASAFLTANPNSFFCYVSGAGTDSTEKGRSRWARVKGKTENELLRMPFIASFMFRPGYIQPIPGLKNAYKFYKIVGPFYPVLNFLFPRFVCRLEEIGRAMIHVTLMPDGPRVLECLDIRKRAIS